MNDDMISRAEAQDLINALGAQRDASHNREAQLSAALAKVQRESAARVAELEADKDRLVAEREADKEASDARIAEKNKLIAGLMTRINELAGYEDVSEPASNVVPLVAAE